jgi:hypothetical protein
MAWCSRLGHRAARRRTDCLLQRVSEELGGGPFAVRSSGVTEDGVDHSFAGMYESVLGVPWDGLDAAVDRVLASAGAARVAAYGAQGAGGMAVIVQHMVDATAAAWPRTADPMAAKVNNVITAVRGTGGRLRRRPPATNGRSRGAATARRAPEQALDPIGRLRPARHGALPPNGVPQDGRAIDGGGCCGSCSPCP